MQNEQEIISRVLNGNLDTFKLLVIQHEKLVISMIRRIIGNDNDVEDISQEVFIKVYQNLSRFKFGSKLSTWIARIAYVSALEHLRKTSGKKAMIADIEEFENSSKDFENPENILEQKSTSEYIQAQISKLPVKYRSLLTLYHLHEMSYQEIEEITGMPEGTVKNYLFRARKLLKDKLKHFYR